MLKFGFLKLKLESNERSCYKFSTTQSTVGCAKLSKVIFAFH